MSLMESAGVTAGEGKPDPAAAPAAGAETPPSYDPAEYGNVDEKTGRPEKIAEKFWDPEKRQIRSMGAILDQLNFLQGKLGEKREKPPKEYELRQVGEWTPPADMAGDPVYQAMANHARDALELSQAQWDGLVHMFWTASEKSGQEVMQAELASIGKDYNERIERVAAFAKANLSPESFQALYSGISSAGLFKAIEELVSVGQPPRLEADGSQDSGDTLEAVDAMWNAKDDQGRRRVEYDEQYRESVRRRRAALGRRGALPRTG